MEETNNSYVLKICVRGIYFNVIQVVAYSIPLLKILFQEKTNEIIHLDSISPSFITHIIDHLIHQKKVFFLKELLEKEFEKENIIFFLKYLGMDELIDKMYSQISTIEGKTIVINVGYQKWKNIDGKFLDENDIDNDKHIHILNEIILDETDKYICVVRQKNFYDKKLESNSIQYFKYYISKQFVFNHMNTQFVNMNVYLKMHICFSKIYNYW